MEKTENEVESVTIVSAEAKSIESVNLELIAFDESMRSYIEIVSRPIVPHERENSESTPDYMKIPRLKFIIELQDPMLSVPNFRFQLYELMERNNMTSYYIQTCQEFNWEINGQLVETMRANNNAELEKIKCAENDEICPPTIWKQKLDLYLLIADIDNAKKLALEKSNDTSLSTNSRLEATFALFRLAYLQNCNVIDMGKAVEKAKYFIDSAEHKADWTGRNKFKAYEGLYGLAVRDYKRAANNLCDCISTFESYELTDFATIVKFTIIACMIAMPRYDIKKKVVNSGLIMQELNNEHSRHLCEYVMSLNECRYGDFFKILAVIEVMLRFEPLTYPHYRQYVRDMKLKAYAQMLQSYSVVSLKRMAEIFGVTTDYVENDVSKFIAGGKLACRIDKINDKIITAHAGIVYDRSTAYQTSIKRGDFLLNRIKRLARIIDS